MRLWAVFVLAATALFVGCDRGPKIVPVAGRVTIDGQPVTRGFVRFVPDGARPAYGEIDAQGRFQLTTTDIDNDGAIVGEHQVEIIAKEFPNQTSTKWLIPKRYADLATSDLKVTITEPTANLELKLEWRGEEPEVEQSVTTGDLAPAGATGN